MLICYCHPPTTTITTKAKRAYLKYLEASDSTKIHHMVHRLAPKHLETLYNIQISNHNTRTPYRVQTTLNQMPLMTHRTASQLRNLLYYAQPCSIIHRLIPVSRLHAYHLATRHKTDSQHPHTPYNSVISPILHKYTLPHTNLCCMCRYICYLQTCSKICAPKFRTLEP